MTMKHTLHILALLLLPVFVVPVLARNVLRWEAEVTKVEQKIIAHPEKKKLPANCAILHVDILPSIPPDFNLEEKTGKGIDEKDLKYINKKESYIEFFFQIPNEDPIRSITFKAKGYDNPVEKEVYMEPRGWYQTTIKLEQEEWVALKLHTIPEECDIYNEDVWIGKSDKNGDFEQLLKYANAYALSIKKEGYEDVMDQIWLKHRKSTGEYNVDKQVISIKKPYELVKIGAVREEKVTFRTQSDATIILRNAEKMEAEGRSYPGGTRIISLEEGTYFLSVEKEKHVSFDSTIFVTYGKPLDIHVKPLSLVTGTLVVTSKPSGAEVIVDNKSIGTTPLRTSVPIGTHTLILQKRNYVATSSQSFTIRENETYTMRPSPIELSKTDNEWWSSSQFFPHHYLEAYYGMGITSNKEVNNYIGMNYTYIRHAVGFNLSAMYGFNNQDIVATAGPAFTLTTQSKTDLDLQLLVGAGYASLVREYGAQRTGTWVAEAGLRFGFENAITGFPFSLWSVYMGAKYYDRKVVPTLGISLMPAGLFALDYFTEESDFSHVFLDPMVGYAVNSRDLMVGGQFAWQKYNVGFYTTFMYGVFNHNIAAVAGPALHLTPDADIFDLTLYGGIGYGRTASKTNHLAGDFGLRFAFGDHVFNWYNFSLGCTTYGGEWIPNAGISLMPVKGLIALAEIEEYDFPAHYTEMMAAYNFANREWMLGTNYTWIPTHLGLYGSFLIGFDGSATVNVGPVFRLTPDYYVVDLQLYQGMGWSKLYNNAFGGETGIRMGFRCGSRFGLFSLNLGTNYSRDGAAISFGLSWVLTGIAATAGLGALFL